MPEQAVVDAPPVVATPVTTPVETTPVVTPPVTPEVDLLTKVSQFKPQVEPDKITNPPEQPEFANITDPVAKKAAQEAVERIRRGFQSDYTKKLEDAQKLVNQSKSWTPERIKQELLTNSEFVQAAQMINSQPNPNERQLTQEEYSALTESEKAKLATVTKLEQELNNMKVQTANEQMRAAITQKDVTLRQKYGEDYNSQAVNEAALRFGKLSPADAREYIFLADNAMKIADKSYEIGKLEGQGKLNNKLNIIAPQGSTVVSNEGVPVKAKGESDKAYFVRLGEFRNAQFKNQK